MKTATDHSHTVICNFAQQLTNIKKSRVMKRSITIILFNLLILDNTFSQDIVDTTFGIDGMVTTDIYYNSGDWLREIELLNDNKILAAGSTHQADTRLV